MLFDLPRICCCRYSLNSGDKKWLGSTYSNKFYLSDLELEAEHGNLHFTVQVLYKSGILQNINQSCKFTFVY